MIANRSGRGVAAENPHAERVDRRDLGPLGLCGGRLPAAAAAQQRRGPGEHLAGRLVGEGDRQDPRGSGAPLHELGDSCDHHPRLAGARTGEHQQRPRRRQHGIGLGRVEAGHADAERGR